MIKKTVPSRPLLALQRRYLIEEMQKYKTFPRLDSSTQHTKQDCFHPFDKSKNENVLA